MSNKNVQRLPAEELYQREGLFTMASGQGPLAMSMA